MEPHDVTVSLAFRDLSEVELRHLVAEGAVWMIETPANVAAARALWPSGTRPSVELNYFNLPDLSDAEDVFAVIGEVEEHRYCFHQDWWWNVLNVIGIPSNEERARFLSELGFDSFEVTRDGFLARRPRRCLEP